jgi:hypothetical protein
MFIRPSPRHVLAGTAPRSVRQPSRTGHRSPPGLLELSTSAVRRSPLRGLGSGPGRRGSRTTFRLLNDWETRLGTDETIRRTRAALGLALTPCATRRTPEFRRRPDRRALWTAAILRPMRHQLAAACWRRAHLASFTISRCDGAIAASSLADNSAHVRAGTWQERGIRTASRHSTRPAARRSGSPPACQRGCTPGTAGAGVGREH